MGNFCFRKIQANSHPIHWHQNTTLKKHLAEITLVVVVSSLLLLACEWMLRKYKHITPGFHSYTQWFSAVDTLVFHQGFVADSDGVFKVDNRVRLFYQEQLKHREFKPFTLKNVNLEVYGMEYQFKGLDTQATILGRLYTSLLKKEKLDDVDTAIINYCKCPINTDGFKSIAFQRYSSKRKKILLIGDSFTWGHNAEPITNCFADYLLSQGFIVYNTGISGSDPAQYKAVAEKYIPLLQPDVVVVNFFMGNDIQYFERKPKSFIPIFYSTNATNLISCPRGVYFDNMDSCYAYSYRGLTFPQVDIFSKLCAKTAIGTAIWMVANKLGLYDRNHICDKTIHENEDRLLEKKPVSNRQITSIDSLSKQFNAEFLLLAIPDLRNGKLYRAKDEKSLFENMKYYDPPVAEKDYVESNGHYSNIGQLKHGKFIEQLVNEK
jgi:hypothetical protein